MKTTIQKIVAYIAIGCAMFAWGMSCHLYFKSLRGKPPQEPAERANEIAIANAAFDAGMTLGFIAARANATQADLDYLLACYRRGDNEAIIRWCEEHYPMAKRRTTL